MRYKSFGSGEQVRVIENGKIEFTSSNEIKNVTPEMVLWYFTNRTKERYQMWHQAHIDFKVIYKPESGHLGSIYYIKEKLENGPTIDTKLLVVEATDESFAEKGLDRKLPNYIYHRVEATPTGTRMYNRGTFGSDIPILGRIQNFFIRNFMLKEDGLKACFQHLREEAENFSEFLPRLYAEGNK